MHCECQLCKDFERMDEAIKGRDVDRLIKLLKEFSDRWINSAEDVCYYQAIFDGSWPSSLAILKNTLRRIEGHKHDEIERGAFQIYQHRIKFGFQGDQLSDWLTSEHFIERGEDGIV